MILQSKKDYISKLLNEMEALRLSIRFVVDQERMVAEDWRSEAAKSC